jgi:mono/diheme cytochrome c family protein
MLPKKFFFTLAALLLAVSPVALPQAQDKASPRERAGAEIFGLHCSTCHGVRLMKEDTAFDLVAYVASADESRFVRASKTARGSMPSFASSLTDPQLADVYAYIKRGHTPDLNDVRMESNH